jgi:hypothetical protein
MTQRGDRTVIGCGRKKQPRREAGFRSVHCNIPDGFSANAALVIEPTPDGIARQLCLGWTSAMQWDEAAVSGTRLRSPRYWS